jgi:hypothetical protein
MAAYLLRRIGYGFLKAMFMSDTSSMKRVEIVDCSRLNGT